MCPNDWEWGGLSWSINFDCLPNDYSSANNSAAACACTDTNMIHGGFPLRATVWFSRCRTPTRGGYLRGGGGGGVSQQLVWLFICLSRAPRPGVIIRLRVCVKGDDDPEQRWCERGKGQRTGDGRAPRSRGAEPPDRPGRLGPPRCVMTSQGKMAALVSAAAPLQRRSEDNHGVLYLFV